jgi:hypothetical protein
MSFKVRKEVFDWFRYIDGQRPFKNKFDIYYLCFLMGISSGKSSSPVNAKEFVKDFIEDYQASQGLIIGLLLYVELDNMGVSLDESKEVKIQIERMVDSSKTMLTLDGFDKINSYANEGFNILFKLFDGDKPRDSIEFLQVYSEHLDSKINNNELWKLNLTSNN